MSALLKPLTPHERRERYYAQLVAHSEEWVTLCDYWATTDDPRLVTMREMDDRLAAWRQDLMIPEEQYRNLGNDLLALMHNGKADFDKRQHAA